ncbi:uncharacterized protein LOC143568404 [Bidens hawaiensis]|uniref:uncharacterized protein LOC143568404 n=1 Tax=Bidens hawaiensis TaxID=980011 RepID=UPI00404A10EA
MDRTEEDMKNVGFFGIFKQSFKTIFTRKKIFSQITLAFILPLAITFIIHMEISHHHFWRFQNNLLPLDTNVSHGATTMEWFYYALFTFAYFIFLTIFSTLSTTAVVFTIASIYTNREVCFRDVIKVISKVWRRLCVTFIFIYIVQFIYDVISNIVMGVIKPIIFDYVSFGLVLLIIVSILYAYGFFYLTVICQLASVITVLEKIHGFKALKKGKALASGKKSVGMGISVVLYGVLSRVAQTGIFLEPDPPDMVGFLTGFAGFLSTFGRVEVESDLVGVVRFQGMVFFEELKPDLYTRSETPRSGPDSGFMPSLA